MFSHLSGLVTILPTVVLNDLFHNWSLSFTLACRLSLSSLRSVFSFVLCLFSFVPLLSCSGWTSQASSRTWSRLRSALAAASWSAAMTWPSVCRDVWATRATASSPMYVNHLFPNTIQWKSNMIKYGFKMNKYETTSVSNHSAPPFSQHPACRSSPSAALPQIIPLHNSCWPHCMQPKRSVQNLLNLVISKWSTVCFVFLQQASPEALH